MLVKVIKFQLKIFNFITHGLQLPKQCLRKIWCCLTFVCVYIYTLSKCFRLGYIISVFTTHQGVIQNSRHGNSFFEEQMSNIAQGEFCKGIFFGKPFKMLQNEPFSTLAVGALRSFGKKLWNQAKTLKIGNKFSLYHKSRYRKSLYSFRQYF